MAQMVLPQTQVPGIQNDPGVSKPGSDRENDIGESRYESVSRAEQKRVDQRKTDARNSEEQDQAQSATEAEPARKNDQSGEADNKVAATEGETVGDEVTGKENVAEVALEMEATATPLTFAELQALLLPVTGQTAVAGSVANNPAAIPGAGLFAGLVGSKPGTDGVNAGSQITDGLLSATGEKAGALSSSSLLTGTRFEATMELVSQQGIGNSASKLTAEAQVPLRSYATSVDVPVNHAEWGDKLMGKLSWLTAKNLSVAEIHLTPPDMGPMEVRVRVHNDQANITVHAANPVVRDQLELHSHRLRDMLGEQGLSLAQFDVSDNARNQHGGQGTGEGDGSSSGAGTELSAAENSDAEAQGGSLDLSWNGAVDIFA
ncbi:flagellar hook-length control protein FliK [Marinobacter sp. ANT_B65]|uniref:flagellar hook-length control protein FliK n=1 Tax=Marinobacter sp. ANT_B65 TaxID=2039467 RepID=UPI000BBF1EE0|nr:flagellar hook-length control protein FliK [Marinobacter sp. ANT_B65]PCM45316.1 flagellar hook-length control protein [Marinobacter sp. ANT_B65]